MTTITIDRAVVEQALEALELANVNHWWGSASIEKAITALRAALAQEQAEPVQEPDSPERRCGGPGCDLKCCQPVQEPIGYWQGKFSSDGGATLYEVPQVSAFGYTYRNIPVYTAPPKLVPLTEEELKKIWYDMKNIMGWYSFQEIARAVEAAHGIGGQR